MATEEIAPWSWRKAEWGVKPNAHEFHAYDVNNNAACVSHYGLMASIEEPNEGSDLCPDCMVVMRAEPWGRELREVTRG